MKIGALIVTTGLPRISGVAALLPRVGNATAGDRLIAALQKAGTGLIGLVTGPENKKLEREFVQSSLIFLRCQTDETDFFQGVKQGLTFLADKVDEIFVLPGDMSLVLPSTMEALLEAEGEIRIPVTRHVNGYPVLLSAKAARELLNDDSASFETALQNSTLKSVCVNVEDVGVLLRSEDMAHRAGLIALQDRQLVRAVVDVSLAGGDAVYDQRLAMLLHLIQDTQSVRLACNLMQISYSTAWNLLNHAEESLGFPLVNRNRGGNSGSGSSLTEKGRKLMDAYDLYFSDLSKTANLLYEQFLCDLTELNI